MGSNPLVTKRCTRCEEHKPTADFHKARTSKTGLQSWCKVCVNERNTKINPVNNPLAMYVNGKYVSRKHPLYRPGIYRTFEDAAFHSLQNYNKSPGGAIYIVTNPAWPGWVKVGRAVDANDRHNSYQTGSPFRDYVLEWFRPVDNRMTAEAEAHKRLAKVTAQHGEWFNISVADAITIIN